MFVGRAGRSIDISMDGTSLKQVAHFVYLGGGGQLPKTAKLMQK